MSNSAPIRAWFLPASLLTLAATALLWRIGHYPVLGIDDAYITLVYARNLASGHGFVYTPGYEAVEGSTSLLWTLIVAALHQFGGGPARGLALALSMVCVAVAISSVAALASRVAGRRGGVLALVWCASLAGYFAWNTLTLMDLALWSAGVALGSWAICVATAATSRDAALLTGVGALLILTRPEAMVLAPALVCLAAVGAWLAGRDLGCVVRVYGMALAGVALTLGTLVAWRLWVFGVPLPNTYYAKVSGERLDNALGGLKYVVKYHLENPLSGLLLVLGTAASGLLLIKLLRADRGTRLAASDWIVFSSWAVITLGHALPLVGGGDHFAAHRFMQPFAPLLIVPAVHWLPAFGSFAGRAAWGAGALFALGGLVMWWPVEGRGPLQGEHEIAAGGLAIGRTFTARTDPEGRPRIGVSAAGGIAYTYEGRIVDLLGLNYRAMAHASGRRGSVHGHAAFQPEVFWHAPPELVSPQIFYEPVTSVCETLFAFENKIYGGLFDDDRFRRAYVGGALTAEGGDVTALFRRDWLSEHPLEGLRTLPWPEGVPVERCNRLGAG